MGISRRKNKGENLAPGGGEFGPRKPGNWHRSCWTGFSLLKCSVLQRGSIFLQKKKGLKGTKFPSYSVYIYIYIYAVELKIRPKIALF